MSADSQDKPAASTVPRLPGTAKPKRVAKPGRKRGQLPAPTPRSIMAALQSQHATRLHMFLIVAACVSVALLITRFLLAIGVEAMWARYAVALLFAYGSFFFGVYCWLLLSPYGQHLRNRDSHGDAQFDLSGDPVYTGSSSGSSPTFQGDGGGYGGGGASGDWSPTVDLDPIAQSASVDMPDVGDTLGDLPVDVGGDEGGCLIVIVGILLAILLAVLFGASIYVIYQAPAILAEVVFEVLLGSPLARGARALDSAHWPSVLLRKTWLPFAMMFAAAMAFAIFVQWSFPQVTTAGEAVKLILKSL
jgi:hypothetical protein